MKNKNEQLKVLFIDIETSLMSAYVFGVGEQIINISDIQKGTHRRILSFAAKWDNSDDIIQYDLRSGLTDKNEKRLLTKLFKLMDKADIIIGQNSDAFDIKIINDGFLVYNLGVPSPYRTIDTYKVSKKYFSPISHKLEYRSENLNKKYKKQKHSKFPGKLLWIECQNGNKDAWKEMADYNVKDVLSTEEYYNRIKPWIKTVNFNILNSNIACPRCQSNSIQLRGKYVTKTAIYQRVHCQKCGSWSRTKTNLKPTKVNKTQLVAL